MGNSLSCPRRAELTTACWALLAQTETATSQRSRNRVRNWIQLTEHLLNLDTDKDIAKLQLGFLDFVVLPLWNAAALLFPGAKRRIEQLHSNRSGCRAVRPLQAHNKLLATRY